MFRCAKEIKTCNLATGMEDNVSSTGSPQGKAAISQVSAIIKLHTPTSLKQLYPEILFSCFEAALTSPQLQVQKYIYITTVLSQWDFFRGKFGFLPLGKPAVTVALPNLQCTLAALASP